jgi:hypothetical protein
VVASYLKCNDRTELEKLYRRAEKVTERECGRGVFLRGLPSNHPDEDLNTNINPRDYDGIARGRYGKIL